MNIASYCFIVFKQQLLCIQILFKLLYQSHWLLSMSLGFSTLEHFTNFPVSWMQLINGEIVIM